MTIGDEPSTFGGAENLMSLKRIAEGFSGGPKKLPRKRDSADQSHCPGMEEKKDEESPDFFFPASFVARIPFAFFQRKVNQAILVQTKFKRRTSLTLARTLKRSASSEGQAQKSHFRESRCDSRKRHLARR